MNELALFAGGGGGILGTTLLGWRTVAAVEIEAYRRQILMRRQADGLLPVFPIWDDIRTFDGHPWNGLVDVVTAGFPCQPFSLAGKRKAEDDERNGWPSTIRIIREVGPRFALLENVPGLLAHPYFGTVLGDLAESGYDAVWDCFSAAGVGADHIRDRLWILAYSKHTGLRMHGASENILLPRRKKDALGRGDLSTWFASKESLAGNLDTPKPFIFRSDDAVANGLDRLEAVGDGQVPAVVVRAWRTLSALI